jgi:hypothetical protein
MHLAYHSREDDSHIVYVACVGRQLLDGRRQKPNPDVHIYNHVVYTL